MEQIGFEAIQMELKYCERCGGLWLRSTASSLVFCVACAKVMAGLFPSTRTSLSVIGDGPKPASQQAFWSEGGKA
jgi:hypothetical protein